MGPCTPHPLTPFRKMDSKYSLIKGYLGHGGLRSTVFGFQLTKVREGESRAGSSKEVFHLL